MRSTGESGPLARSEGGGEGEPAASGVAALRELAAVFLRLGTIAFGGPAAHIAMMRDEVVRRRRWLSDLEFLDLLGATNLIPGPNSTEMAIHVGRVRGGWAGLLVAGVAFIAPAALIVAALAWAYVELRTVPALGWLLYGVKPVVVAIVAHAIASLAPVAARSGRLVGLGLAALAAVWLGANELAVLLACGLAAIAARRTGAGAGRAAVAALAMGGLPSAAGVAGTAGGASALAAPTLAGLFWVFLKIGSVLFGSGYVLLAFLETELVERLGWLTRAELLDAVAIGQVTPGPLFTTATFVGYLIGGFAGALVATVAIFLPAFVLVAMTGAIVPRLRASANAGAFLDGVNVASLALMVAVTVDIARAAIVDLPTLGLALASLALLLAGRAGSMALVLGGAVVGVVARATGWSG